MITSPTPTPDQDRESGLDKALASFGWEMQRTSPENADKVRNAFGEAKAAIVELMNKEYQRGLHDGKLHQEA